MKETLIIAYDGEALNNHEMDIEELALALTGLSDLFKYSNALLNKNDVKISLKIQSLETGSFEIHVNIDMINAALSFLGTNPQIIGLTSLLSLLGLNGVNGLIQLVKTIKNNKITKIEENGQDVILNFEDNSVKKDVTVNKNVFALFGNISVMNSFNKIMSPLTKQGIDSLQIRDKKKNIISQILKHEAKYFKTFEYEEETSDFEMDMWLSIVSISFRDGNKWKFSNNYQDFYAIIKDDDFLNKVNKNEIQFSKGDTLKAHVIISQVVNQGNTKPEYIIKKVLEFKKADTQLPFNFSN